MKKVDLRTSDWREAIVNISDAVEKSVLTKRALALLIADSADCKINITQILSVLNAMPRLKNKYLK